MDHSNGHGLFERHVAGFVSSRARGRLLAFMTGALSILSMAPFFFWPVLWLTIPTLLALLATAGHAPLAAAKVAPWQRCAIGRAAETGWWFGFGYHALGLFWIGEAFLVEADVFAWLLPVAVTGLPAVLALFTAAGCAASIWAVPNGSQSAPILRVLALAIGLGMTEWLRGHVFTGFPWNVLGYALTAPDLFLAGAGAFGIYGLTIIAVLVFGLPAVLWANQRRIAALLLPCLALAALYAMAVVGEAASSAARTANRNNSALPLVRVVQPSVPQREKWRPENQRRIFDDHLALSLTNSRGEPDDAKGIALIVWPEAAMPFLPLQEPVALAAIGRMLPNGVTLATGALRADPPAGEGARRRVYNSLILFGRGEPSATVLATYDKTHLVPFGEYLPLQGLLEAIGLQQLSRLRGGFASGAEPRSLIEVPGVGQIAPLICYEAIFPGRVVQSRNRPRAILNVTNDGWFGNTTGPRQHLHMARVRAVEEGVPVVRVANNGISAVIDASGAILARLDLNVRGTIDVHLPMPGAMPLYARWGDGLFAGLLIALGLLLMSVILKRTT